ncbi:transcriptional regulatory protein AlgP-like [Dunckerocampus dactyliophorus]|uniref:transcriptional regulatory protein AlgP-like n=1 Tax=Dunckerocampus dactyliophorus TaxID=161453 RepID=UPI0024064531|nr:transcriptional regulatory protein AlgP-like [Dunckerocampus dactyliophorus]
MNQPELTPAETVLRSLREITARHERRLRDYEAPGGIMERLRELRTRIAQRNQAVGCKAHPQPPLHPSGSLTNVWNPSLEGGAMVGGALSAAQLLPERAAGTTVRQTEVRPPPVPAILPRGAELFLQLRASLRPPWLRLRLRPRPSRHTDPAAPHFIAAEPAALAASHLIAAEPAALAASHLIAAEPAALAASHLVAADPAAPDASHGTPSPATLAGCTIVQPIVATGHLLAGGGEAGPALPFVPWRGAFKPSDPPPSLPPPTLDFLNI